MSPLVSVLVPMYNHAHYIPYALRSVLNQTYSDWECIVVDDGSTDEGAQIVRSFAAEDRRIRLLQQSNQGLVGALNTLAQAAQGELLTTLDADDCFLSTRLADGVDDLRAHPELSVSFCGVETIDGQGKIIDSRKELLREPLCGPDFHAKLVCHNFVASCAGMIRRSRLEKVGPFARPVGLIPDWDLWLRLAAHGELALRKNIGVQVRWDGNNMSSRSIRESAAQHIAISRELTEAVCQHHNLDNNIRKSICDMRIAWSRCLGNFAEVLRSIGEKKRFGSLGENDWTFMVEALIQLKKFSQAAFYLRELTQGKLAQHISIETREKLCASAERLAFVQQSQSSKSLLKPLAG